MIDLPVRHLRSQLIVATHSPILMACPDALIYELSERGIRPVAYEDTEHFQVTREFLTDRDRYFRYLFADDEPDEFQRATSAVQISADWTCSSGSGRRGAMNCALVEAR